MSSHADVVVAGLGGQVLALSTLDGSVKWEHQVELGGELALLVWEDAVLASAGGRLVCIGLADGHKRFDVEVPGNYQQCPRLERKGSRLLVASAGEVVCFELDGRHPRVLWHNRLTGRGLGKVALA